MAILCEGNTKVSLTTLSFSIKLSSDSIRYCMLWTFASFFQPHPLTAPVAFGPFLCPGCKDLWVAAKQLAEP